MKIRIKYERWNVCLNTDQMVELFDREKSNIRKHIINIFKENNNGQNLPVNGVK